MDIVKICLVSVIFGVTILYLKEVNKEIAALMLVAVLLANSEDPAPWGMIAVFVIIFGGIIVGVVVALVQRLGEVKRGEIDEASKY